MGASIWDPAAPATATDADSLTYTFATGAITRPVAERLRDRMYITDWDGANWDQRLDNALAYSYLNGNKAIHLPSIGTDYIFSDPHIITQGVMLWGDDSQGSSTNYGTVLQYDGVGDFLTWDGSGIAFRGTGGGLANVLILKSVVGGGDCIKVVCTDDNHRPGEMWFERILAYARDNASSLWGRGLHVDGTLCNTPGARGVRHLHMLNCRFAETSVANECILLNQVTHFFADQLSTDVGNGVDGNVTIKGINDGIHIDGAEIGGNITIHARDVNNTTDNLSIEGMVINGVINNDDTVAGTLDIARSTSGAQVSVNYSRNLKIRSNVDADFQLRNSAATANNTGDGTIYTIPWLLEEYDSGNNIAPPVTGFTCQCAGTYHFDSTILLENIGAAHTAAEITIAQTGSVTRSKATQVNIGAIRNNSNRASMSVSGEFQLAAGDVVSVKISVSNSTKTVGLFGAAGTSYTSFSGKYLG